jgi:hypothetical protein
VLGESEKGLVLFFALALAGLMLSGRRFAALWTVLAGAALAVGYGLLADLSDTALGFWGASLAVMLPMLIIIAAMTSRGLAGAYRKMLTISALLVCVAYPYAAGLDDARGVMYLNICALIFLAMTGWALARRLRNDDAATVI